MNEPKRIDPDAVVTRLRERADRLADAAPTAALPDVDPTLVRDPDHDEWMQQYAVERLRSTWAERIPERFQMARLDHFSGGVARGLTEWAENAGSRNLVIYGPPGTGKTYAAVAACRKLHGCGLLVKFSATGRLIDSMRPGGDHEAFEELASVDVLIWDDIGREYHSGTGWAEDRIYDLVNERWNRGLPTVFTSNLAIERLEEVVGDAVFDRMVGSEAVVIKLFGKSKRRVS